MDDKLSLTIVILTLNEKDRLERCLSSCRFASQVVIVDSFSTDGTLSEAARLWKSWQESEESLVLVQQTWQGFEKTRNQSFEFAAFEWVLWIDADEWVSPELEKEIRELFGDPQKLTEGPDVYRFPRLTYFLGRPIYHGGWYPDRKKRLGRKGFSIWRKGPHGADVHEDLDSTRNSRVGDLRGHLYHETFRSIQEQEETNRRYSSLLAEGLAQNYRKKKKTKPGWFFILIKVGIKFLENYFFKKGFLDGYPGFLIAKGSAKSLFWRYEKLRSLLATTEVDFEIKKKEIS